GLRLFSELTCIHLALILHHPEVPEDKINAFIKAAGVNVRHFWPGLFAKALANVHIHIGSLTCNVGAGGPSRVAACAAPGSGPAPFTTAVPAVKKVQAKKEESEQSDDDMGLGLFD
ncbi:60S acidic ribosomal protein P1-like, partial [Herpailurus yagouaroundi]|uniref:60S acidic ribosomal protein P1-like n=1 Tax=Herpailurus yagouaroundi TaxID=1608482 RepID=UPI001AD7A830